MQYSEFQDSQALTREIRHRKAAELCEKAARHHHTAAKLHASGDGRQAETHAEIARLHSVYALAVCDEACEM
jgi:hypothetical protein